MSEKDIRDQILSLTKEYYQQKYGEKKAFQPGDRIAYSGRVFDEKEMVNLVDSGLEFWLTHGRYANQFEKGMADYLGVKHCIAVNSGSSANLVAFMSLTSPLLGDRRILPGDEVITVAAAFPTTISPIVQYGAIPVFLDVEVPTYNIDVSRLEEARTEKTKAIMIAHTLGNPFDLQTVVDFCRKYKLWLVEDNCDALGSRVVVDGKECFTGTVGDFGTSSFYPPHQMTLGEGGAVYTNDPLLHRISLSLRDWGRDCQCPSGVDNVCGHRYDKQFGELPLGYDHKFVYSHFGYNLKITDMQGAVGCAQLEKLPSFVAARKRNWKYLREALDDMQDVLLLPEKEEGSDPCWFGFLMMVKENANFTRVELSQHLEKNNIQTRNLFAGNILRHPAFDTMRATGEGYRIVGDLKNTDDIMNRAVWIGVYPGLSDDMLAYMVETIRNFCRGK